MVCQSLCRHKDPWKNDYFGLILFQHYVYTIMSTHNTCILGVIFLVRDRIVLTWNYPIYSWGAFRKKYILEHTYCMGCSSKECSNMDWLSKEGWGARSTKTDRALSRGRRKKQALTWYTPSNHCIVLWNLQPGSVRNSGERSTGGVKK